jgi:hypothetical protein
VSGAEGEGIIAKTKTKTAVLRGICFAETQFFADRELKSSLDILPGKRKNRIKRCGRAKGKEHGKTICACCGEI